MDLDVMHREFLELKRRVEPMLREWERDRIPTDNLARHPIDERLNAQSQEPKDEHPKLGEGEQLKTTDGADTRTSMAAPSA